MRGSYAAVFLRLARYYGGKGAAGRKFFWGCLGKALRSSPRVVGQMVIYLGMYKHFSEVHQRALSWDAWAPLGELASSAPVASPRQPQASSAAAAGRAI